MVFPRDEPLEFGGLLPPMDMAPGCREPTDSPPSPSRGNEANRDCARPAVRQMGPESRLQSARGGVQRPIAIFSVLRNYCINERALSACQNADFHRPAIAHIMARHISPLSLYRTLSQLRNTPAVSARPTGGVCPLPSAGRSERHAGSGPTWDCLAPPLSKDAGIGYAEWLCHAISSRSPGMFP